MGELRGKYANVKITPEPSMEELRAEIARLNGLLMGQRMALKGSDAACRRLEARVKELERERNHANDIADAAGRKIKELEEALKQAPCQLAISHEMGCPVVMAMDEKSAISEAREEYRPPGSLLPKGQRDL